MKSLHLIFHSFLLFLGASLSLSPAAFGQDIEDFGIQKSQFGDQTQDDTSPVVATNYSLFAYADTDNHQNNQASTFTVSDNDTVTLNYTGDNYNMTKYIGSDYNGSNYYPTLNGGGSPPTGLNTAFTAGDNYTITAQGEALDGESAQVPITADSYAPFLYLTGSSYTAVKNVNPNSDFTFTIGAGTNGGTATANAGAFGIFDNTGELYQLDFTPGATTLTIPQSELAKLTPGETYTGALTNFNTITSNPLDNVTPVNPNDETNAFLDANYDTIGFTTTTNFDFIVAPEPTCFQLLLLAALGGVIFRLNDVKFRPSSRKHKGSG